METYYKSKKIIHLAGIVPVAGYELDFQMPWPDAMLPIAPNYLAVERAVFECANAGCETIWVVAFKGTIPLLRKRLGDYIRDPCSTSKFKTFVENRDISIFYVPILPRDRYRRDSLGWSILHGADTAFRVSAFLSKWVTPEKYYCAMPYGVCDESFIRSKRFEISDIQKTIFTFNNKSIKDGLHISFTFDAGDYKRCRDLIRQKKISEWYEGENNLSAKKYTLDQIFSGLDISTANMIELPWFYDIGDWSGYKNFLSSEHSKGVERQERYFLKRKRKLFAKRDELRNTIDTNQEHTSNSIRNYDDERREETTDT